MRVALVGGKFDVNGGRRSGYVARLKQALEGRADVVLYQNGGHYDSLAGLVDFFVSVDVVLWFADVPNELPKLVGDIKKRWPTLFLVTSKANFDDTGLGTPYNWSEILGRALKVKANLTVEFTGHPREVEATVLDPLGSAYCLGEKNIEVVAKTLVDRLERLRQFKRVACKQVGDGKRIEPPQNAELDRFYAIVREQAEKFHAIIHDVGHERMMGNASFRCAKGFPSFREGFLLYVSQRDIDKRFIGPDAFVAVSADALDPVYYYGPAKPSVDTPIQVRLYSMYSRVRFMLHSHTYIEGAPTTKEPIPCGAVEEADAVGELVPDLESSDFCVNLLGHGSIVFASNLDALGGQPWIPRPVPEMRSPRC